MIVPELLFEQVANRDPRAEEQLNRLLWGMSRKDYETSLGPLAEDYLQQLSLTVVRAIRNGDISDPKLLIPWCKKTAANIRMDGLRSAARIARKLVPIDEARTRRSSDNIEAELIDRERFETVLKVIERLDPITREIIRRHYFERQPARQIQRDLDLTPTQYRGRKAYGVQKLRKDYNALNNRWRLIPGGKRSGEEFKAAA